MKLLMSVFTDIGDQISHLPHWIAVMLGVTAFGVYWKKSRWPNHILKFINLLLPMLVYPAIHYSKEVAELYWNPIVVLGIHGLGIGVISEFFHEGLVTKLKLMGMKFPEEAPSTVPGLPPLSKTDTELQRRLANPDFKDKADGV